MPTQPVPIPIGPSQLGESPFWQPEERALYWSDIPGRRLHRYSPADGAHRHWDLPCEAGSCAPIYGGGLLLAMRDGVWRFDTSSGERERLALPPYDPACERFNDGKADPSGRFWVGTIYEPRDPPLAALYRLSSGAMARMAADITVSNGLAWSPDGKTMYWSDTKAHTVFAFDVSPDAGDISGMRPFARFAAKVAGQSLDDYAGRPDGAAVDSEGCYWVAMFEGQRVLRLSPQGELLATIDLPVRCPTMPCFGGDDLKTLFITTAREGRSVAELSQQPEAGRVLQCRVDVAGLPVNFVRL